MKKEVVEKGQALITLLFFTIIGVTVTSAAVVMILLNSLSGMKQQQGEIAYEVAQSGMDEAIIRFLRDPNYTGESKFQVGNGTANISRLGTGPSYTFVSTGTNGIFTRKVQATVTYQNNLLQVSNRKEIFQ